MRNWREAARNAWLSGTLASVLSTLALGLCGRWENRRVAAPTNAISHWIWGDGALLENRPTLRHTALGYGIHHAASVFWATLYEKWFSERGERDGVPAALAGAAAVAALACVVDFRLTPQRLTPGFENRLSKTSIFAIYTAFGAGLGLAAIWRGRRP